MQIEFNRDTCIEMFQCVAEWDQFHRNKDAGKADLLKSEEAEPDLFIRGVPEDEEFEAEMAGRVCPVNAITVYDNEGNQLVP